MARSRKIECRRVGYRTIAGTDWPVDNFVTREALPGRRPRWLLTLGLCNGVPDSAVPFASRRAALAELAARGGEEVR